MTSKEIAELLSEIYSGFYNPENLPIPLYNFLTSRLEKGLFQGYGGTITSFELNTPNWVMLSDLRLNVYEFSAAKTFQEILDIQSLIVDETGFIRPFKDFEGLAGNVFEQYNEVWLETEYNTTIQQSLAARDWTDFEEAGITMLKYQTQNDPNVRHEHALLDNITRPRGDKFWDKYAPKNGWNCRCYLVEAEGEAKTDLPGKKVRAEINKEVPPAFRFNPGKERVIFDKAKHPYFDVPEQFKELKSVNFNLPLPT